MKNKNLILRVIGFNNEYKELGIIEENMKRIIPYKMLTWFKYK